MSAGVNTVTNENCFKRCELADHELIDYILTHHEKTVGTQIVSYKRKICFLNVIRRSSSLIEKLFILQ